MLSVGKQFPRDLPTRLFPQFLVHGHLRRMHNLVLGPDERQKRRLFRYRGSRELGIPFLAQEERDMEERAGEGHDEWDEGLEGKGSVLDDNPVDL